MFLVLSCSCLSKQGTEIVHINAIISTATLSYSVFFSRDKFSSTERWKSPQSCSI